MSEEWKTDWQAVARASLSTCEDLSKGAINCALGEILERFATPIGQYFTRRSCKYPHLDAEEMLAEFYAYLLTERKKIFRKADPGGRLRNYLYCIAWSFANRYIAKNGRVPAGHGHLENAPGTGLCPEREMESAEEREYVELIVNLAMMKLKTRDRAKYDLLKYKYFSGSPGPSARDLGIFFGLLGRDEAGSPLQKDRVRTAENAVNQRLHRAREAFSAILTEEIDLSLEVLSDDPGERERLFQEKRLLCRNFLDSVPEFLPFREVNWQDIQSDSPGREVWEKILEDAREDLCAYFGRCLGDSIPPIEEWFARFRTYFFEHEATEIARAEEIMIYPYCAACKFVSRYQGQNPAESDNYHLMVTHMALAVLKTKDRAGYELLQRYLSGSSGAEMAVSLGIITAEEIPAKPRKAKKAQQTVYQRVKRAKQALFAVVDETLDTTLPIFIQDAAERARQKKLRAAECRRNFR